MDMTIRVAGILLLLAGIANAQTTQYPPYPAGMRLQVGSGGVLPRNTPSLTGTCGKDNHVCTPSDAIPPGIFGVVQSNPPVFEAAGWWWIMVNYENGINGWSSGYPPYLNMTSPPQMAQGFSFRVAGDYSGPTLTSGRCYNDGVVSNATLNLQAQGTGQTGTMSCLWTTPPNGNHIAVIEAINNAGTMKSSDFQFSVTAQAVPQPPVAPSNLRIAPTNLTVVASEEKAEVKK
jgi:hypothetical protein